MKYWYSSVECRSKNRETTWYSMYSVSDKGLVPLQDIKSAAISRLGYKPGGILILSSIEISEKDYQKGVHEP